MKFSRIIHRTALYYAITNNNIEIVKLLLSNDKLNINAIIIFNNIHL